MLLLMFLSGAETRQLFTREERREGWKQHYSLYPANDHLVRAFKNDLAPYEVSKGTIRFPLSDAVPDKLIGRIAKFRAKQAAERAPSKPPVKKKG